MANSNKGEVAKLQQHLSLLKEQYVKLQKQHGEIERKYSLAAASAGDINENSFISRLLQFVTGLFDQELYSDMKVKLDGRMVPAHRFVLAAQSEHWGVPSLADVESLDWSELVPEVGTVMLKWLYTDQVDFSRGDTFTLDLMRTANGFKLVDLVSTCEKALMASVNVKNAVQFYTTADEIAAETLKEFCSSLISAHWEEFTGADFAHMNTQLLFRMLKAKTGFPLHAAIRLQREDVVFLYLVENNADLPDCLNVLDTNGELPLGMALREQLTSIAQTLVEHRADLDVKDNGWTMLHRAVERGDSYAASFLIEHNASVEIPTPGLGNTPLHMIATYTPDTTAEETLLSMTNVAKQLMDKGLNPNLQNQQGFSALHLCVMARNEPMFRLLLARATPPVDLDLRTADGHTPLWFALIAGRSYDDASFAAQLIARGAQPNPTYPATGDTLLHLVTADGIEPAAIFLAGHASNLDQCNARGETALHAACRHGRDLLARRLLAAGADPDLQTRRRADQSDRVDVYKQTALHVAIANRRNAAVDAILDRRSASLDLKDSAGDTALALALSARLPDLVGKLIAAGADVDVRNGRGLAPIHQAILDDDVATVAFLLDRGADSEAVTADNETPLQLAIDRKLRDVVESLCRRGVDTSAKDVAGRCPLWAALAGGDEDVASVLVRNGADTDAWDDGPDGCQQTLLHRAIDENDEAAARFLVQAGCDLNAPRRAGPGGRGGDEAKERAAPLHLCCQWGLASVVQTLVEHGAAVNQRDAEGRTALHVAVANQHAAIITLLLCHPDIDLGLRDRKGLTPFATALTCRNNKAAQAILDKMPTAADQFDNKGRNFLHMAIQKGDMESVLFLLSIQVDVNTRVQDASQTPPLHLAAESGSEMLVRSLLLAGARPNDKDAHRRSALHAAAAAGHASVVSALLQNGADFDATDSDGDNALHVATRDGQLAVARTLLTESRLNAEAVNLKGRNPMHVLAKYAKDNAAGICELCLECMPEYPLDKPDVDGNSALLLAYMQGNGNLCRALVKAGACLGMMNREGVTIFNYQVATKQLLYRLLDLLSKEPPWADSDVCLECGSKFGLINRQHHCRHCGRALCSKCSDRDVPILKYGLNKPVRVCGVCFDVLQVGSA